MVDINDICGHSDPIRGDQADTLVMYDLADSGLPGNWEQLWSKRVDGNRFVLCCIPFFASGLGLGDTFTVRSSGGFELTVDSVVERSGNVVIHVIFREESRPVETQERQDELIENVNRLGIQKEIHQLGYVALSCPRQSPEHEEIQEILRAYSLLEWSYSETLGIDW